MTIEGGTASDTLRGNAGNDVIQGHQGNNTLIGNSGEDELYAGTGNDRMNGGADDDHLWGSNEETGQSNTFVISEGNDVFDFNLDSDLIEFDGRARDLRFAPTSYGDDIESTLITRLDGKGTATLVGISVENFLGHKPYPPIILPIDPDGPKDENGNLKPIKQPIFRPGAGDDDTDVDNLLIIGTIGSDQPESDAQYPRNTKFVGDNRDNILLPHKTDELLGRGGVIFSSAGKVVTAWMVAKETINSSAAKMSIKTPMSSAKAMTSSLTSTLILTSLNSMDPSISLNSQTLSKYSNDETPAIPSTVISVVSGDLKEFCNCRYHKDEFIDPKPPIIDPEGNELPPITGGGNGGGGGGTAAGNRWRWRQRRLGGGTDGGGGGGGGSGGGDGSGGGGNGGGG